MKTILILIFLIPCYCSLKSQSNFSFEDWDNNGDYEDPIAWNTFNVFSNFGGKINCNKTGKSHWGSYAAQLSSTFYKLSSGDTLPGTILQIFPFNKRIKSFSIYYKYSGKASDSASILLSFFKGRNIADSIIGSKILYFSSSSNWTKISGDILWSSNDNPDTMSVYLSTSFFNSFDTLVIDDLEISEFKLSEKKSHSTNAKVFTNSNQEMIFKNFINVKTSKLIVRNILGQSVYEASIDHSLLDLNFLSKGIYFYELYTEDQYIVDKFIIE